MRYLVNVGFWNLVGGEPSGDACRVDVEIDAPSDDAASARAAAVAEKVVEDQYGKRPRKVVVMKSADITGMLAKPWRDKTDGTAARIAWSQMGEKS